MRSRRLRIAMLCWLAWWFGLYIPIHQRGYFQLPGGGGATAEICRASTNSSTFNRFDSCCEWPENSEEPVPQRRGGHCAVCKLAMMIVAPPPIDLGHRPMDFIAICAIEQPPRPHLIAPFQPNRGRAPPQSA